MKIIYPLTLVSVLSIILSNCSWNLEATEPIGCKCGEKIIDTDGKEYSTTWIDANGGNDLTLPGQCWMAENLNYGEFLLTKDLCTTGLCKYCFDNNVEQCDTFGGLYTSTMVQQRAPAPQYICPKGWHIPSDYEWMQLEAALGMPTSEINKIGGLADRGVGEADKLLTGTGFNFKQFGYFSGEQSLGCFKSPDPCFLSSETRYWTSTPGTKPGNSYFRMIRGTLGIGRSDGSKENHNKRAYCVRCIKD